MKRKKIFKSISSLHISGFLGRNGIKLELIELNCKNTSSMLGVRIELVFKPIDIIKIPDDEFAIHERDVLVWWDDDGSMKKLDVICTKNQDLDGDNCFRLISHETMAGGWVFIDFRLSKLMKSIYAFAPSHCVALNFDDYHG